jgi:hypothetical protein
MPSFLLSTHKQCILSHFIHNSLLCSPKNLIPWRDSNPGLLVPQADAMSTPSGHLQKGLGIPLRPRLSIPPTKVLTMYLHFFNNSSRLSNLRLDNPSVYLIVDEWLRRGTQGCQMVYICSYPKSQVLYF